MIHKLRAGMMPPSGARRPAPDQIAKFVTALESRMDALAAADPNPGWRPFQRLNRAEYAREIRSLLDLDVDVTAFLPADTISDGFDNVADVQTFSPTLMEGYLRAASRIAMLAIGDPDGSAAQATFKLPKTASQMARVEGAPPGTRGGISVDHTFVADGDYVFSMDFFAEPLGFLFGNTRPGEEIEVSLDGARLAIFQIDPRMSEEKTGLTLKTRADARQGRHASRHRRVHPALRRPDQRPDRADRSHDGRHRDRHRLRHHHAAAPAQPQHRRSASRHRRQRYAEPPPRLRVPAADAGRRNPVRRRHRPAPGDAGVPASGRGEGSRAADDVLRARPQGEEFRGRHHQGARSDSGQPAVPVPRRRDPVATRRLRGYRLGDYELASRLSFFLWGRGPDAELLKAAGQGRLALPGALRSRRAACWLLPDADALATRFASQWLRLQDLEKVIPDPILYPYSDQTLSLALKKETELFFNSLVREDRSLLDLLTADYTYANERVARHYGIPNVTGAEFRRVTLPADRRGILGHGSILTLTSIAERTSPVQRGKWVMEVLLGSPPPPPPPNVPALEETKGTADSGRALTVRERMEQHRSNPQCTSCHRVIDPLGLALENFDATGKWRIRDGGMTVDTKGQLFDGTVDRRARMACATRCCATRTSCC